MPKYTPMEDDMDGSYGGAVTAPEEKAAPAESVDEQNAGATEILIAKDKLPSGTKEGDECTFRITKDFGDEFSLEYVKETESAADTTEPTSPESQELAALSEEGA